MYAYFTIKTAKLPIRDKENDSRVLAKVSVTFYTSFTPIIQAIFKYRQELDERCTIGFKFLSEKEYHRNREMYNACLQKR